MRWLRHLPIRALMLLTVMQVSVAIGATPDATTAPPEPEALIASLARPVPAETVFAERRVSPLLAEPLLLSGRLRQPRAGTLLKMVETPYVEQMMISDGRVSVQREGESNREFSLRRAPALVALSAGFEALLSGDVALLMQHFAVTTSGTTINWQLELTPTDRRLSKRVEAMRLFGSNSNLRCIDVLQQGGEDSRMWLDDVATLALTASDEAARDALCSSPTNPGAAGHPAKNRPEGE